MPSASGALRYSASRFHVLRHDVERVLELVGRAELHDLGAGVEDRCVARSDVVRVAGLEGLVAGCGLERDLSLDDVAPVRALAAIVGAGRRRTASGRHRPCTSRRRRCSRRPCSRGGLRSPPPQRSPRRGLRCFGHRLLPSCGGLGRRARAVIVSAADCVVTRLAPHALRGWDVACGAFDRSSVPHPSP